MIDIVVPFFVWVAIVFFILAICFGMFEIYVMGNTPLLGITCAAFGFVAVLFFIATMIANAAPPVVFPDVALPEIPIKITLERL